MGIFYENYVKLCASRGESLTAVSKKVGLSNAAPTGWKNGKNPSEVTLEKLAAYFGVTVAELKGEAPEQKEKPSTPEGDGLDQQANEFAEKFKLLDASTRALFNSMLDAAIAEQMKKNGQR